MSVMEECQCRLYSPTPAESNCEPVTQRSLSLDLLSLTVWPLERARVCVCWDVFVDTKHCPIRTSCVCVIVSLLFVLMDLTFVCVTERGVCES